MRNLLATVPQGAREAIAAIVRTIFAQPDHATALTQLRKVADGLRARFAAAPRRCSQDAAEDVLAYRHLPLEHQRQLHSTNPLERLNKEIKRRSNVVGIFPTPQSVIRLVGAILLEQDDEWAVAERRYFSAESMKQLDGADAAGDGAGDLRRDRVKEGIGVGACGNRSVVSKQRWTVLFPSTAAAASTPWSNSGTTCAIYTT